MTKQGAALPPVDVPTLERWVRGQTRKCNELERLSLAVKVGVHLDRMSDELVGRFVEEARLGGASWSQIGERLGVTKQAAHQRHTLRRPLLNRLRPRRARGSSRAWERFGDRGQQVVAHAQ